MEVSNKDSFVRTQTTGLKIKLDSIMKFFLFYLIAVISLLASCKDNEKVITKYKSGNVNCESEIKNGKKNGKEVYYYESGNIMIKQHFKNGLYSDSFFYYYENGKIKEKGIAKLVSRVYSYDTNGVLSLVVDLDENEKRNGFTTLYSKDSCIFSISNYLNNEKSGIYIRYFNNGNIKSIRHYKEEELVPPILEFDSISGTLLKNVRK